MRDKLQTLV